MATAWCDGSRRRTPESCGRSRLVLRAVRPDRCRPGTGAAVETWQRQPIPSYSPARQNTTLHEFRVRRAGPPTQNGQTAVPEPAPPTPGRRGTLPAPKSKLGPPAGQSGRHPRSRPPPAHRRDPAVAAAAPPRGVVRLPGDIEVITNPIGAVWLTKRGYSSVACPHIPSSPGAGQLFERRELLRWAPPLIRRQHPRGLLPRPAPHGAKTAIRTWGGRFHSAREGEAAPTQPRGALATRGHDMVCFISRKRIWKRQDKLLKFGISWLKFLTNGGLNVIHPSVEENSSSTFRLTTRTSPTQRPHATHPDGAAPPTGGAVPRATIPA